MLKRLRENSFLGPLFDSKLLRTRALSWITAVFDIGYGLLALGSGFMYGSWWLAAVGLYYGAMLVMALHFGFGIRRAFRMDEGPERQAKELRVYRNSAWALLLFNLMLTGVTVQMVHQGLAWRYPPFLIYAVAAFTFGYLGVAIAGVVRGKPDDSYIEQAISLVNLAKGIVGILFLTTALIVEFGGESESFRIMMESAVAGVCMPSVIIIAVYMLVRARREERSLESG